MSAPPVQSYPPRPSTMPLTIALGTPMIISYAASISAVPSLAMIVGASCKSPGNALKSPSVSPSMSLMAASRITSMLSSSDSAILTTASTAAGTRSGSASPMPSARVVTISTAPSAIAGSASVSFCANAVSSSTAMSVMFGSCASSPSPSAAIISSAIPATSGITSGIASTSSCATCGRASDTACNTGITLSFTLPNASITFCVRFTISASEFPSPAIRLSIEAVSKPIDPLTVSLASRSKLPAYCSVFSKKYCMAISAFWAFEALSQATSSPLESVYAFRVVAFMATPRLSIMV